MRQLLAGVQDTMYVDRRNWSDLIGRINEARYTRRVVSSLVLLKISRVGNLFRPYNLTYSQVRYCVSPASTKND
jgi:hypothetical protein